MNLDQKKDAALSICCDIATHYTHDEVVKFAPPSVQIAWDLGNKHLNQLLKESRENRKRFTL